MQVEQLEQEVAELRQALSDKTEQENAMIQVLFVLKKEVSYETYLDRYLSSVMRTQYFLITYNILQVLMRVEQEQKITEDARILAEQDAAAQRYALEVLQVSCSIEST